ncbi:hypothetical protein LTR78_008243 [Recurvomyces mirabilis]|uniref:DUF654-domain-containing protein n=1 Tax=Recurvomyces mirabilis TaxID=574656 RepID=A0AAE0TRB9_9PEZI|nr:hypothetical protein LTR78_008243 [Recurvomyces mirabilis]KAK5156528.1 hypothetical protein LTS14_004740 [Recurvomyces mirabilis]
MSSRALRKAQREREEQEQVRLQQQEEEDDEAEQSIPPISAKASAFAMLGEDNDDDEDEDGGAPLDYDKDDDDNDEPAANETSTMSASKKKKKKKRSKKKATQPEPTTKQDEDLVEIDKALRQLATNGNHAQAATTAAGVDEVVDESSKLLAVDTTHLHAQNEMRRLFGRAALEAQDDDDGQAQQAQGAGGNRRQQRQAQQMGLAQALRGQGGAGGRSSGLAAVALKRNIFIQGKEDWPVATGGGLGMEVEEKRADGTILYRFVHNRSYQDVQAQFETCVESMDPDRMVMLLRHNPYHISTLLQVSEIAKQQGDHSTSGDLLERALFSFGRSIHSTFTRSIGEGKARLDFRRPENREFWLASWRYMTNLSMRVYEWAKLLLSLSPEEDPYALWLVLDQYALRSRQDLDYLNISRNPGFCKLYGHLPNVQISQALAESRAGNKSKGKQALFTAVGRYPWIFFKLMREVNLDPPPAVWGKEPSSEKDELYTELYALRAKDFWNTPEISALLVEVASAVPDGIAPAESNTKEITEAESRHTVLSDVQSAIHILPNSHRDRLTTVFDPLPPLDDLRSYETPGLSSRNAGPNPTDIASNLHEFQDLVGWFAQRFPWMSGQGVDGADAERPSEDEIRRQVRESGESEQTLVQRTQRMGQLQQLLQSVGLGRSDLEGVADSEEHEEHQQRTLEDADEPDT